VRRAPSFGSVATLSRTMSAPSPRPVNDAELNAAIADLPAVSAVMQRILAVLADPHSDLTDIGRLIRSETALSAQVVRMANSAFYGLPEPVGSIEEAIQRLGFSEVNRLVGTLSSLQLFQRPFAKIGLTPDGLWQHALAVAVSAETVSGYIRIDRGMAYLAGILHPVGLLALDRIAATRQLSARGADEKLLDWEQRHFGCDNAVVAARVLRAWKFPDTLAATVAGRYVPAASGDQIRAASMLHIASCLAEKLGAGLAPEKGIFLPVADRIAAAGLQLDEFGEAEIEAGQNLQRTRAMLKLA